MTDKQIIIDGVDVSGCNRLNTFPMQYGEPHEICLTSLEQWGGQEKYCKDRPNCYYKNWQRKEQECEELKNDNLQEVGQLKFAIGTLTAENLHLKELLDMRIEALCDSCKAGSMLPIKCRIYEKILTEIKEIAITGLEGFCPKCSRKDCEDNNCIETAIRDILQKISECEVE